MSVLNDILTDLRARRLWPAMLLLVVALVAVPVLLAKSSRAPAQTASVPVPPASAPSLPLVNGVSAVSRSHPNGRPHDPFAGGGGGQVSTAPTPPRSGLNGTSTSSSPTAVTPLTSSGSTGGTTVISKKAPTSVTPVPIAKPPASANRAPTILGPSQVYRVSLALSYPSGGLDTLSPLQRLAVLPSDQQPLLVYLGVLKGAKHVLFDVQPGAVLEGPGQCTPGPIDCQILSLGVGQNESLSVQTPSGTNEVALFAVTAIRAHTLSSPTVAMRARRHASLAGGALLSGSQQSALPLFRYQARLGAVVDLRNLSIGG